MAAAGVSSILDMPTALAVRCPTPPRRCGRHFGALAFSLICALGGLVPPQPAQARALAQPTVDARAAVLPAQLQTPSADATPSDPSGFGLTQLMAALAQVKGGEATFVEKRSVSLLERTLESSGRLSFEAPDTFVRETLRPRRERVAVVGNTVTMSLGSGGSARSRTLALDTVPEAAVIVEAIRGTLTGNRAAIERHFDASVSGNAQRWAIDLVPREPRLREQVISVRVSGQRALVREVIVALADGDRSVMTIEPLAGATTSAPTPTPTPSSPSRPPPPPPSASASR